ncbi:MAG TPA: cytidylate kinase family protein [Sporichthyaceae bacterium]|jgi:hypothetical protein|nr:cytidylate kinase family protein [Sporichthyaceae bacterium]
MSFQVVCLSAVDGSGGEQVGPLVAQRLGYRMVDDEIVALAAREAQLDQAVVADVERRKSAIIRLLDRLGPGTAASATLGAFVTEPLDGTPAEAALRDLIRATIGQVADAGRVGS